MNNNRSKRPQSCYMKDLNNNKNKNKHIPINCVRNPSATNNYKNKNNEINGIFTDDNKNYAQSQNSYTDKFKSQVKRINMYNEMWNKSFSDEDYFGISKTIKIQPENKKSDNSINSDKFKVNATNTRVSSAATYCDIGYKSKRLIKGINSDFKSINLNSFDKNKISHQNNKISTNTIDDVNKEKDKDNLIHISSNYNTIFNKNNFNTDSNNKNSKNLNYIGTNTSINLTNSSNAINYKSFNKDLKTKEEETIPETEYRKTLDMEDKEVLKKAINDCDTTTLNLRTEYLIKLSKLLEITKKFEQHSDNFRVEKREIYSFNLRNFSRSFDKFNDLLLNEIKTGEVLDMKTWAKILVYYFNMAFSLVKYEKNIFSEMHFMKNENLNLKQKLFSLEGELNIKNKDIADINKYIVQYDLTNKVKYGKKKELSIKEIKQKYISQESAYILTIYKLEEEIKQLTNVLEKNKYDVNNYQIIKAKLKKVEEDYERDKENLEKQNDDKDVNIKLLSQGMIDLNEKISELENEIQQLKDKEENVKHDYISFEAKITNLNDIIKKKNTLIEELEKENKTFKEKKDEDGKMLEPAETIFIPQKEKIRKRKKKNNL